MAARMWIYPRYAIEIDGKRVQLTDHQGAALARLFTANGCRVPTDELVEAVYFDDPDGGPLWAVECVRAFAFRLRKQLAGVHATVKGSQKLGGYRLILP
jgi:DNA-binding response OmpR family regulator